MVFIILPLATANTPTTSSNYLQRGEILSDGDIDIPDASNHRSKLAKLSTVIVTPGETVTEDPQWMRHVFYFFIFHYYFILYIYIFFLSFLPLF